MSIDRFLDDNYLYSSDTTFSMESLTPHLLRGEQLTISEEGFMDIFRSFKDWLLDDKPSVYTLRGGWTQNKKTIVAALEKTYLNPEWLAKRTLETNPIKAAMVFSAITVKGEVPYTASAARSAIDDYTAKLRQVSSQYSRFLRTLDNELLRHIRKLTPSPHTLTLWDTSEAEDTVEALTARITVDYRTLFGNTHISRAFSPNSWSEKTLTAEPPKQRELTPLSREEVVECCGILLELSELWVLHKEQLATTASLRAYNALEKYLELELSPYIRQQSAKTQGSADPIDVMAHNDMVTLVKNILDIPERITKMHYTHTAQLINAYARLIDQSVK